MDHHHNHHAHEHAGHAEHDKHAGHSVGMFKSKFWLSLALTIPTLLFSEVIQDWLGYSLKFAGSGFIPALLGTFIFFYGGLVFIKGAVGELKAKQPGMMTLISLAITVAFVYSAAATLNLVDGMDFWWELATLVTIMLLGHWLEMASVESVQGALNELAKLLPDKVEVLGGDKSHKVPISELVVGDIVLVRPGAKVPIDGVVIKGSSEVNESMLTGESKAVKKTVGSEVVGGTVNKNGALTLRVERVGDDTTLAGIMQLVEDAQNSKSRTQQLADTAAFYLTFVALAAALMTWIGWWLAGESSGFIFERVVTVLVIACPHALGLAIPLVTAISTTKAARNGLLVRDRMALEQARAVDVVLFDKTGTLTKGEQGVVDVVAVDGSADDILAMAASAEKDSEHHIGQAILAEAKARKLKFSPAKKFEALPGRGVSAQVAGKTIYVGGLRLLEELQIVAVKKLSSQIQTANKKGQTVVYVIAEGGISGIIVLADVIREESKEAVATLQNMGKKVALLTGDSKGVAAWVADELGIDKYFAEVLPGQKTETVKKLQASGKRVAMVGDGVNDAPALVQADIGIAIGAGTDVAIESAGIVLASSDPRGVAKIVKLSRHTFIKMVQNLAWATGYNLLAIPLAAGVLAAFGFILSPAVGAVLMSLSTIIVAINAQTLRRLRL